MNEEKKIVSFDQLAGLDTSSTKAVFCPAISKLLGSEVHVKVRAIEPLEIMQALNFPLSEVNDRVMEDGEGLQESIKEHAQALGLTELFDTMRSVVKLGLVEPTPDEATVSKLLPDHEVIFSAIVKLTMPEQEVESSARFPADG